MYKREATEYDTAHVKKYDEDLNTTLIFVRCSIVCYRRLSHLVTQAGLFSAVSSAFVIDIYSKLQPDSNDQSAALLLAILLTLNHSAVPNETLTVPILRQNPPGEVVTTTSLLFASLLMSLLAAFIAMLGKQWLNRYLRHTGGSIIDRCGDRQIKCDGLQEWPFHLFVESLPVMLQAALLFLACGLCRYMASINTTVAAVLIGLTLLGVLFYGWIVIAGAYSYACPFQTPASVSLRGLWTKLAPRLLPAALPIIRTLHILGKITRSCIFAGHLSLINLLHHVRSGWKRIRLETSRIRRRLPWPRSNNSHPFLPSVQQTSHPDVSKVTRWLSPKDVTTIQMTSANDARCVSWILRGITDPEALDAALPLAGTIRWFEDGAETGPPYDILVSTFHSCFDSNGELYPGSRDRAYYSGQAILWIYTLVMCKSDVAASMFPLPDTQYKAPASDNDLTHLLNVNVGMPVEECIARLLHADKGNTPSHLQWISNVLLHQSWASRATLNVELFVHPPTFSADISPPLNAVLNCLLMYCNFLGFPVEEEVLKVQDKLYGALSPCTSDYSYHYSLAIAWN